MLVRLALKEGPVIAGVRDKEEIEYACRNRSVDHIVWVDRPWCEDTTLKFTKEDCYHACKDSGWRVKFSIIDNSKSLLALHNELRRFCLANDIPLRASSKRSKPTGPKPLPPVPLDAL